MFWRENKKNYFFNCIFDLSPYRFTEIKCGHSLDEKFNFESSECLNFKF